MFKIQTSPMKTERDADDHQLEEFEWILLKNNDNVPTQIFHYYINHKMFCRTTRRYTSPVKYHWDLIRTNPHKIWGERDMTWCIGTTLLTWYISPWTLCKQTADWNLFPILVNTRSVICKHTCITITTWIFQLVHNPFGATPFPFREHYKSQSLPDWSTVASLSTRMPSLYLFRS